MTAFAGFWKRIDAWICSSEEEYKRTQRQLAEVGWRLLQCTEEGHWRACRRYEGVLTAATAERLVRKVLALPASRRKPLPGEKRKRAEPPLPPQPGLRLVPKAVRS